MSPTTPLGPYPQLLLCPHVGNTPTSAKIRIIRSIVPMLIECSLRFAASWCAETNADLSCLTSAVG